MRARLMLLAAVLAGLAGCSSTEPADVAGVYSVNLTNRENPCSFTGWTEGMVTTNIPLDITQDGDTVTADVGGLAGTWLNLVLGDKVFRGSVDGASIDMTIFGTRSVTEGNCAYTVNATATGRLSGDVMAGDMLYVPATNGSPECGAKNDCSSRQQFNGARPPQE